MHPVQIIYSLAVNPRTYGNTAGICRITGQPDTGLPWNDWVRDTFTDLGNLKPGNIVSNAALFCFDESNEALGIATGKNTPQKCRNYGHFVADGLWYPFTKAQKAEMFAMLHQPLQVCVIADSGQKHLLFKHRPGTWQLEEHFIQPDIRYLKLLHTPIYQLGQTFSIEEIETGQYQPQRIAKFGLPEWKQREDTIKPFRGSAMFDLSLFFSKIPPL